MTETPNSAQQHLDQVMADTNAWSLRNILAGGVCDFCARPHVVEPATFIAKEVMETITVIDEKTGEVGTTAHVQDPYWSACPACTVEIERDRDGERLAEWIVDNCDVSVRSVDPAQQFVDLAGLYTKLYEGGLHRQPKWAGREHLHDPGEPRDEQREQSDLLWVSCRQVFRDLLPDDEYTQAQYADVREEAIERVMRTPGIDPRINRKTVAQLVDERNANYQRYAAQTRHDRALHVRRRETLVALGDLYIRVVMAGNWTPAEGGSFVDLNTDPEVVKEVDQLMRQLRAIPAPKNPANMLEFPPEVEKMLAHLDVYLEAGIPELAALEEARRINARRERIEAHRQPDVVMEGTKCSNCKRRPARVDDLCKRCAHEAGTLPHGKIGEGD